MMSTQSASTIAAKLRQLDPAPVAYACQFVDALLPAAEAAGASDVHLHPVPGGLEVRWRLDGVLQTVGVFSRGGAADVVTRLKVMAGLLTYRNDLPQEGRVTANHGGGAAELPQVEIRVSTFPTLYGERAVIRFFAAESRFHYPADLGLPEEIRIGLENALGETSGAILITGPAGCGKTTAAYCCLRHITQQSQGRRNLVSLEDPIEIAVPGVSQSQVHLAAGFDLATGLRSLMRQDPEVILVGEIRDRIAAETAFQAALTGHLLLSTFHAGNCAGALSRLADMGIEPYLLRSGIRTLISQRLARRLCRCARPIASDDEKLGLPVTQGRRAAECESCAYSGYHGRMLLAEILPPLEGDLAAGVLAKADAHELERLALAAGQIPLLSRAIAAVELGQTDPAEIRRVLGSRVMDPS